MRWFRRRKPEDEVPDPRTPWPAQEVPEDPAVAAGVFWRRWFELLPEVNAALGDREPQRVEHELSVAVAALHPDLHFSLERGQRAIYALVVTGQEDPAVRPYTDAWREAAPEEDAIWEYHDSVPPVPDPSEVAVNLGGRRISLGEFRVGARVEDGMVDVEVYHPELAELDEAARSAMTFLPLDATLGERLAGERLRRVEAAESEPAASMSLLELRELVRGLGRTI
ncbi:hypothetical protein [Amycolatopsis alkalitolerans]|uniref:Uncharacterized protein n=1 Tax=Amycolatopsis alkalitolerans TaxID=2547244 RepID=A0A5C4LVJ4_9PSEU|nr:hypothetical protein [Amycolatopsis alkalitolerans]TNC23375.1 hypothetical protein FG385_21805 [Amycolatopsis alkalitolerans]